MAKGDFLLHLGEQAHERLRLAAEKEGTSMAQLLKEGLEMRISAGQPGGGSLTEALRLVGRAAQLLADSGPGSPLDGDSWEALMKDVSS
jgi:hypothetical protein